MPIYEYLCPACNRIYSFLVRNINTSNQATCPKCGSEDMKKRMSSFAFTGSTHKATESAGGGLSEDGDLDPRAEREMMKLMSQAENIDENDPRQLGTLMRKMSDITGEKLDCEMEEAVRRLEAGEDPDKIEESLGDLGDGDMPGGMGGMGGMGAMGAPTVDDGLYSL